MTRRNTFPVSIKICPVSIIFFVQKEHLSDEHYFVHKEHLSDEQFFVRKERLADEHYLVQRNFFRFFVRRALFCAEGTFIR